MIFLWVFKVQTMYSNYVIPARPNSLRSWTWWAWPPSHCMSEDCKKLCRNGFRIHVSLSIPLFLHLFLLFTLAIFLKIIISIYVACVCCFSIHQKPCPSRMLDLPPPLLQRALALFMHKKIFLGCAQIWLGQNSD